MAQHANSATKCLELFKELFDACIEALEYEKAVQYSRKLAELDSSDTALRNIAEALFFNRQYAEAAEIFAEMLRDSSTSCKSELFMSPTSSNMMQAVLILQYDPHIYYSVLDSIADVAMLYRCKCESLAALEVDGATSITFSAAVNEALVWFEGSRGVAAIPEPQRVVFDNCHAFLINVKVKSDDAAPPMHL